MINAAKLDWIEAKYRGDKDKLLFKNESDELVVELDLPNGLLRKLIDTNAASSVFVNLDGTVRSEIDEAVEGAISHVAIDELVARDTAAEMLEDEPDAEASLKLFEKRLKRSLDLVATALNRLKLQKRL